MRTDFISPDSPAWGETLNCLPHDLYHTGEWMTVSAEYESGRPLAFYAEDLGQRFFAPLLIRPIPVDLGAADELRDTTGPYGYACPLASASCEVSQIRRFLDAFMDLGRQNHIVTAFFRMHPFFPVWEEALRSKAELVYHGETVYVDLNLSRERLLQQMRSGHKEDIRKLQKAGYRVFLDDWAWYDPFIALYTNTMQRRQAHEYYFFPSEYFYRLKELCANAIHLCGVFAPSGELAAAALFLTCTDIVQYHLSASAPEFSKGSPTKLILDHILWWAKDLGYKKFHLGGGLGAAHDSLFAYKAGFSHQRGRYWTYRVILDSERYCDLSERRRVLDGGPRAGNEFFPEYR